MTYYQFPMRIGIASHFHFRRILSTMVNIYFCARIYYFKPIVSTHTCIISWTCN